MKAESPYELVPGPQGWTARVRVRGHAILALPLLNRGSAFSCSERDALGLTGLLPARASGLDVQLARVYGQYLRQSTPLEKHVYLANLRDRNEVLFYRLLTDHIEEMLPIVYTPTIGTAIERFSHEFRRPRGLYLSVNQPEQVATAFANLGLGAGDVDLLVATDGEGILGIGDWGVGGAQIAVGKLAVYTAAAGIHPSRVVPVMLDVGTDNVELLGDPLYLGNRHARVRDERYDALLDAFVASVRTVFPHAMLHWEDLGASNARRVLHKYQASCCTFNDDMQGTAVVVLAAVLAALRENGTAMRDQRVIIHGAGTAGIGIADMMRDLMIAQGLAPDEATARFYALGSKGLISADQAALIRDFQLPYARSAGEVAGWSAPGTVATLADVVREVHPTILIGTSAQPASFTEALVRDMAAHCDRPVILPLSNPTSKCEALPADLLNWTQGRALIATGSPFAPVVHDAREYTIAQANNALVFPGLGLGVALSRASRVTDGMLVAAADALARIDTGSGLGAPLLPAVDELRAVSRAVAIAVARAADAEGLAQLPQDLEFRIDAAMWRPDYPAVVAI
ncbi:MAG: NAD-dependent malic enzyme [Sporichthyaceae bacterium]